MIYPRKTKIICTIGPATESFDILKKMIEAGMDIARLNFSHGSHDKHKEIVNNIREASIAAGREIGILQDLQGPKIRTEQVMNGSVILTEGQNFTITHDDLELGTNQIVRTSYSNLAKDLKVNDKILIDDGYLILKVFKIRGNNVECTVIKGGILKDRKGIIAPGVAFSAPALSDKDIEDLKFGLTLGIDFVALSFVSSGRDIVELKTSMKIFGKQVPIIAKIERPEAIKNIDEIINESDGIMIARGDLGLEYPVEDVPLLQKELIRKCNAAGTPVITATQMLESMINSPRPTRAEASDVSNAVFDGSDVLMLSGETSVGTYPVDALNNMINIILKTENQIYNIPYGDRLYTNLKTDISDAISHASTVIAEQINASAIAAITSSSNTVRNIARFRPRIPIVGITNDRSIMRRLNLFWGTIPICLETITKFDDFYNYFISNKDKFQFIDENSFIVFVSGLNNPVSENLIKVYQL